MPVMRGDLMSDIENDTVFEAADHVVSSLTEIIGQIKSLTHAAISGLSVVASDIMAGRIKSQNEIEGHLDRLLNFCFDDECLKLYNKILDSIENKYPGLAADYRAIYDDMWGDNSAENDEYPE